MLKVSKTKFHQNWTTKSRVIHVRFSIPRQYQMMMPSVAWVKFIKSRSYLGIIPKAFETKFRQIRITKSKVIHVQIPVSKWEKTKKWEKIFGLHNEAISALYIGTGFRDYRPRQEGVQIVAALKISNRGKKITNRSWDFKSGQSGFKSGQRLQIGAEYT